MGFVWAWWWWCFWRQLVLARGVVQDSNWRKPDKPFGSHVIFRRKHPKRSSLICHTIQQLFCWWGANFNYRYPCIVKINQVPLNANKQWIGRRIECIDNDNALVANNRQDHWTIVRGYCLVTKEKILSNVGTHMARYETKFHLHCFVSNWLYCVTDNKVLMSRLYYNQE